MYWVTAIINVMVLDVWVFLSSFKNTEVYCGRQLHLLVGQLQSSEACSAAALTLGVTLPPRYDPGDPP